MADAIQRIEFELDGPQRARLRQFTRPYRERAITRSTLLSIPAGFAFMYVYVYYQYGSHLLAGELVVFAAVSVGIFYYVYWRSGGYAAVRQGVDEMFAEMERKPKRFKADITVDGLVIHEGHRKQELFWHNVEDWREEPDAWFLRHGKLAVMIPYAAFASGEEFDEFGETVSERLEFESRSLVEPE